MNLVKLISNLALTFFGLTLAFSVEAAKLPYTYVEGTYAMETYDDDSDISGLVIGGSFQINDRFFLLGSWEDASDDDDLLDRSTLSIGAGFRSPLNRMADLVATLTFDIIDVEVLNISGDADGLTLKFGGRALVSEDKMDVTANLIYSRVETDIDEDDDYGIELGARYNVHKQIWLGYQFITFSDADANRHQFSVRYAF